MVAAGVKPHHRGGCAQLLNKVLRAQLPIEVRYKLAGPRGHTHEAIKHHGKDEADAEEEGDQESAVFFLVLADLEGEPVVLLLDRPIPSDRDDHAQEQGPRSQLHHPATRAEFHPAFAVYRTVLASGLGALISIDVCRLCLGLFVTFVWAR